jgi:hypothetical protein
MRCIRFSGNYYKIILFVFAFILLHPASGQIQPFHVISGFITDSRTGERLIGANLQTSGSRTGAISNNYGFYSLRIPEGNNLLRITYVGYQEKEINLELKGNLRFDITMERLDLLLDEVVVETGRSVTEDIRMSSNKLDIETIKKMPALAGEVDLLRSIQLLPGVQGGSEGTAGFFVRGGSPDQNLILVDGVPVYNVSHLFGFLSIFNADAINNVEIIKGGFPARFGGRLSSVLDISLKEGNLKEFQGNVTVSMVASKFTIEGPILTDKMSYLITGRRSFLEPFLRPVTRQQKIQAGAKGGETTYAFYDFNTKINYILSTNDRLYLSFYQGRDDYFDQFLFSSSFGNTTTDETKESGLAWGNRVAALRWNHLYGPRLFSNLILFTTSYQLDIQSDILLQINRGGGRVFNNFFSSQLSEISDQGVRLDFNWFPTADHNVKFGFQGIMHTFRQNLDSKLAGGSTPTESVTTSNVREGTNSAEFNFYVEDEVNITPALGINAGLHFSNYRVDGLFYPSFQPRFSMRWKISDNNALKAGYASMTQYLHLLSNSGLGLPTDLWVSANRDIRPQDVKQVSMGYVQTLLRGFDLTIESFYKQLSSLIDFKEGASFFLTTTGIDDKITSGIGEAYGVEFLVKRDQGKTNGWVAYTLSWSNRTFPELNAGNTFPFNYDRRHDLALVVNHSLSKRWSINSTWVFSSGRAVTLPLTNYVANLPNNDGIIANIPSLIEYSPRNAYRYKPYHRLDISATRTAKTSWGSHVFSIGLYNAYNRLNTFYITLDEGNREDGTIVLIENSLFPVIPGISYGVNF